MLLTAEPDKEATADGTFGGLRSFPSNPYQTSELPPPKSPFNELVAGALLGAAVGVSVRGAIGFVVGAVVGALDGLWVAKMTGARES